MKFNSGIKYPYHKSNSGHIPLDLFMKSYYICANYLHVVDKVLVNVYILFTSYFYIINIEFVYLLMNILCAFIKCVF